jgi:branched-chain amino acid transport system ATP-binding protein
VLEVLHLNAFYENLQVLWDVSLSVDEGEIVTLIGSNGAGKSTLVSAIFGLAGKAHGSVRFSGEELLGKPTYDIVRKGMALVPEKRELFPRMSVRENLALGAAVRDGAQDTGRLYDLFPILREREGQLAGTLSGGEQQMLAIARCLMTGPQLLVLDEPSLGLSPKYVSVVLETLKRLNGEGLTILLVEQNVRRALEISNRGYVMEGGRITLEESAGALLNHPHVRSAYLGL